jgi:predicted metal-binding membrane protein
VTQSESSVESLLKRDRWVVAVGIVGLTALAWAYLVYLARDPGGMDQGMMMAQMRSWTIADFGFMFLMWATMMVGMMVPTAAPMVLLFAANSRRLREQQQPYVPTVVFLSGYVVVWSGFAVAATLGNWALHVNDLMSSMMGESVSIYLGGGLLIAAGLFQLSPLKYVCLKHCRSPLSFLTNDWREGSWGAFNMGLRHGAFCLGCCWMLMGLLFVLGIMNLIWIAALAAFVLLEKVAPAGQYVGMTAGILLIIWGVLLITGVIA